MLPQEKLEPRLLELDEGDENKEVEDDELGDVKDDRGEEKLEEDELGDVKDECGEEMGGEGVGALGVLTDGRDGDGEETDLLGAVCVAVEVEEDKGAGDL